MLLVHIHKNQKIKIYKLKRILKFNVLKPTLWSYVEGAIKIEVVCFKHTDKYYNF